MLKNSDTLPAAVPAPVAPDLRALAEAARNGAHERNRADVMVTVNATTLLALLDRAERAENALALATTPNIVGIDTDCFYEECDYDGLAEEIIPGDVRQLDWANRVLEGEWWAANVPYEYSDDFEEVEESEIRIFRSEAEARAAVAAPAVVGGQPSEGAP